MRISDWSSDVCSSDLNLRLIFEEAVIVAGDRARADIGARTHFGIADIGQVVGFRARTQHCFLHLHEIADLRPLPHFRTRAETRVRADFSRSEEHTSELQSLMRISYAVFCLKQKKDINNAHNT